MFIYERFNRIEAAKYLGVSTSFMRRIEGESKIKYSGSRWHGDRYIYFLKEDLDEYIKFYKESYDGQKD